MTEQDRVVVLEDNHRLRAENDTLRRERDEARQEICHTKKRRLITHLDYARKRGWNCFWVDYSKQQEMTP